MKIIKRDKETFYRCQGNCKICFNDGACILQNKINKYGLKKVKRKIYGEEA